jgi:hypothetical protein
MNQIVNNLNRKRYDHAFSQFEGSFELLKDKFEIETYENPSQDLFKFVRYVGEKSKKSNIVYFCSMILATSLNYFENAYKYSYNFAEKLTEIEPHNLENWQWLLFFCRHPR